MGYKSCNSTKFENHIYITTTNVIHEETDLHKTSVQWVVRVLESQEHFLKCYLRVISSGKLKEQPSVYIILKLELLVWDINGKLRLFTEFNNKIVLYVVHAWSMVVINMKVLSLHDIVLMCWEGRLEFMMYGACVMIVMLHYQDWTGTPLQVHDRTGTAPERNETKF